MAGRSICWTDFKTIWNLIYHLDALFTERRCTPGKRANESLRLWPPGEKRESVDKATGAHYLVGYACPRSAIDGWQRTVWSRQMWLDPTLLTKDDQAAITRPWKWHVGAVILDYLSSFAVASACGTFQIRRDNKQWLSLRCCEAVFDRVKIHNVCSGSSIVLVLCWPAAWTGERHVVLGHAMQYVLAPIWLCLGDWSYLQSMQISAAVIDFLLTYRRAQPR